MANGGGRKKSIGAQMRAKSGGHEKFWRCGDGLLNWLSAMNKSCLGVLLSVSAVSIAGIMLAGDGPDDPICRVYLEAEIKTLRTPVHVYTTMGSLSDDTGSEEIETITIGDVMYSKVGGQWKVGKALVVESIEELTVNPGKMHCEYERDEPFEGEAAAVYRILGDRLEMRTWISKTRGLTVYTTYDLTRRGSVTHASVRYDYTNVHAPEGAVEEMTDGE